MLTEAEQFFYDHAGWSYSPETETPEVGRERGAIELARAEERMKNGPYYVTTEPDDMPWGGDFPYDGPMWIVSLWSVEGVAIGEVIGSIGGVACESGDPYMRVVRAELALEHIPAS